MVFLTRDKDDCLDVVKFPPGTHGGILVLNVKPPSPALEKQVLTRFLTRHYKHCKGNTVELTNGKAIVNAESGQLTVEF